MITNVDGPMRCAHGQVSVGGWTKVSWPAFRPVHRCGRGAAPLRRRTGPTRLPGRCCRSTPEPACAWRWFSRRRPGRSPAAVAPRRARMAGIRAACPASKASPLAADSNSAGSTVPAVHDPGRRCGPPSRRLLSCQNAGGGEQVGSSNRVPSTRTIAARRNTLGSLIPSSGRTSDSDRLAAPRRRAAQPAAPHCRLQCQRPGRGAALGSGHARSPRRTPLHRRSTFSRRHRHPLRVHGRARRAAGVERLGDHGLDRFRSAEGLGGLGVPECAARPGCGVRVWRPGSPRWACWASCNALHRVGGRP